jgi:hypothetical protein
VCIIFKKLFAPKNKNTALKNYKRNFIEMDGKTGDLEIKTKPLCMIVLGMAGSGKVC